MNDLKREVDDLNRKVSAASDKAWASVDTMKDDIVSLYEKIKNNNDDIFEFTHDEIRIIRMNLSLVLGELYLRSATRNSSLN